jgi:hypothetical protein
VNSEGALGGSCFPSVGAITTAAERLQGSSMTAGQIKARFDDVQIYAVSGER